MPNPDASRSDATVPDSALWQGPMAWAGSPPRPVANYSREFPADATFVRAELIFQLGTPSGPGAMRVEERAVPGLIRLDRGKPVEVHAPGPDGQCWTYRRLGRASRWALCVGPSFPAGEPAAPSFLEPMVVEQVVVQSVLPKQGTGKVVSFVISSGGRADDLSRAVDPDPND